MRVQQNKVCNLCPLQTVTHILYVCQILFSVVLFYSSSLLLSIHYSIILSLFNSGTSGSALVCSTGNSSLIWVQTKPFSQAKPFYWCLNLQLFSATSSCIPNPVSYFIASLEHIVRSTETEIHWLIQGI